VPCEGGDALAHLHVPQLDRVVEGGTDREREKGREGGREGRREEEGKE